MAALKVIIESRYRNAITDENAPLFLSNMADAIQRRLDKGQQLVDSETSGPFSVRWNAKSNSAAWFLPEELAEMDDLAGLGGARSYRTPAPDGIRFNNRLRSIPDTYGLSEIANETIEGD